VSAYVTDLIHFDRGFIRRGLGFCSTALEAVQDGAELVARGCHGQLAGGCT
jgi:hypothetical protein